MKHTPGPWKIGSMITSGTEAQHIEITHKGDPYMIAKVCVQGDMVSIGRPNARLIAAAPELLDALKAVLDEHSDCRGCESCDIALAAIQKAEGRY